MIPGGLNEVMEYQGGDPKITKEVVTVLKLIDLKKRAEEIVEPLLNEVQAILIHMEVMGKLLLL